MNNFISIFLFIGFLRRDCDALDMKNAHVTRRENENEKRIKHGKSRFRVHKCHKTTLHLQFPKSNAKKSTSQSQSESSKFEILISCFLFDDFEQTRAHSKPDTMKIYSKRGKYKFGIEICGSTAKTKLKLK